MGVREGVPDAEPELRDYLVGYFSDRRQAFVNTAQRGSDKQLEDRVRAEFGPVIDRLLDGKAVTFHRFQLPEDHPQAPPNGGDPSDNLILDEHDVLRPDDSRHAFVPPRRPVGDWRTNGQVD